MQQNVTDLDQLENLRTGVEDRALEEDHFLEGGQDLDEDPAEVDGPGLGHVVGHGLGEDLLAVDGLALEIVVTGRPEDLQREKENVNANDARESVQPEEDQLEGLHQEEGKTYLLFSKFDSVFQYPF